MDCMFVYSSNQLQSFRQTLSRCSVLVDYFPKRINQLFARAQVVTFQAEKKVLKFLQGG